MNDRNNSNNFLNGNDFNVNSPNYYNSPRLSNINSFSTNPINPISLGLNNQNNTTNSSGLYSSNNNYNGLNSKNYMTIPGINNNPIINPKISGVGTYQNDNMNFNNYNLNNSLTGTGLNNTNFGNITSTRLDNTNYNTTYGSNVKSNIQTVTNHNAQGNNKNQNPYNNTSYNNTSSGFSNLQNSRQYNNQSYNNLNLVSNKNYVINNNTTSNLNTNLNITNQLDNKGIKINTDETSSKNLVQNLMNQSNQITNKIEIKPQSLVQNNHQQHQAKPQQQIPLTPSHNPVNFNLNDGEIYFIKESTLKRSCDLVKKTMMTKPSSSEIEISKEKEFSNVSLVSSIKETINLFEDVYNIESLNNIYNEKMETKYKYFFYF